MKINFLRDHLYYQDLFIQELNSMLQFGVEIVVPIGKIFIKVFQFFYKKVYVALVLLEEMSQDSMEILFSIKIKLI
jgi:hypothetical protein